ncbi:MAG: sigma-54 dependent transcriptional regulator [Bacteroidota bacterium]
MEENARILIVDDEEDILISLEYYLKARFAHVKTESRPSRIPDHLREGNYDLVLLDMNFGKGRTSGGEGLDWLKVILQTQPSAAVIMMTAYAEVEVAVEAVKLGAVDFIEKPWRNEKLHATLLSALQLSRSRQEVRDLQRHQQVLNKEVNKYFGEIIGHSPAMQRVFDIIDKVAQTEANILILGENGTGKELVARAIHKRSQRADAIFVGVDLGAVPETLFESELFGHVKGAFTDARENREGQFEVASGGTLFLDEIGNLALPMQAKMLSALQNRSIRRIGANQHTRIDIRLVCATNMPLYEMVKDNQFRTDLLYRINTVELQLPPLRERREDIPLLTEHFLEEYTRKYQKDRMKLSAKTMKQLQAYHWPGNIRELRHAVERAVILAEGLELQISDFFRQELQQHNVQGPGVDNFNLAHLEKWAIQEAMKKYQGNITKAAEELGLTRAALYRRLSKHQII